MESGAKNDFEIVDGELLKYNGSEEKVIIPDGVTYVGRAFRGNSILKEVEIPGSVREIAPYAFHECKSLEKVTLNEGLVEIGTWAFGNCCKLRSIRIPKSVRIIHYYSIGFEGDSESHRFYHDFRLYTNDNMEAYKHAAWHHVKRWP